MLRIINFLVFIFLVRTSQIRYLTLQKGNSTSSQVVIDDGRLDIDFSDIVYNQKLCCKTQLYILEMKSGQQTGYIQNIILNYNGTQPTSDNIIISVEKQGTPLPRVKSINENSIILETGCLMNPSDNDYWSKVDIVIFQSRFSFRLHCDQGERHRNFQWGYVIIMFLNSSIMIGVALHSRIWSLKLKKNKALGIPVTWIWLLIFVVLIILIGGSLVYLDSKRKNGKLFGIALQVIGDIFSLIFGVIILDQIFFLQNKFKRKVYKFIRICDILSILVSLLFVTLFGIIPSLSSNVILNNILSVIISVGAIKLFKFLNLKEAIICCSIIFAAENIVALFVHFFYHTMSYNDLFGSTVNSPLVTQMPILSYSLYQKCSWLPVTQIILPGITIAYLRRYDYSRDSKLYLIIGNLLFVFSTFLWILIQSLSVHALPFALITYPALFIPIIAIAYKRDQLKTLLKGQFYDPQFIDSSQQKQIVHRSNQVSQIQESTLQGLIPESQDMEKSAGSSF